MQTNVNTAQIYSCGNTILPQLFLCAEDNRQNAWIKKYRFKGGKSIKVSMEKEARPIFDESRKAELEAFLQQEQVFRSQHKQDSDEELISYVQQCAKQLGRRPNKRDVVGYTYLKQRLGPWHRILEKAGLKEKTIRQIAKEEKKNKKIK